MNMRLQRGLIAIAIGAVLAGCEDQVPTQPELEPTLANLAIVSGGGQTGPAGAELTQPIVVKATNETGAAIANQIINFRVTAGGGSVFAGVAKTNSQGLAQERWTLGNTIGEQTLEARAVHTGTGEKLVFAIFKATATDPKAPPPPTATPTQLILTPARDTVEVGSTVQLAATVRDQNGQAMTGQSISWVSLEQARATVDGSGKVTGVAEGSARIVATSGTLADTSVILVQAKPTTTPPTTPPVSGDFVVFPNENWQFIIGPQLKSGSAANPYPFFDQHAIAMGTQVGQEFMSNPVFPRDEVEGRNYYDQALVQYTNYYRTGDTKYRTYARAIADAWWKQPYIGEGKVDPANNDLPGRQVALGGLILRAMDGRPEMWPWTVEWAREMYDIWLGWRINGSELHYGVRDGGYTLLYVAWLAKVHPDAAIRAEMKQKALVAARDYYARLQYSDGSFRWRENPGGSDTPYEQPFMVGMLMEAMVAVHQLTGDPVVAQSILKATDHLYSTALRPAPRRALWYMLYGGTCNTPTVSAGCADEQWGIDSERQLNTTVAHVFGYAYLISGNSKYKTWGDSFFDWTYGGSDGHRASLGWVKEYNMGYRTAGRYLAYRMMR